MIEIWKSVINDKGVDMSHYEVSNKGRVRGNNGIIKPRKISATNGDVTVKLYKDGKSFDFRMHRLVAFAFIGMPVGDRDEVNYKDYIRTHNFVYNLEWITLKENARHAVFNRPNKI